MTVMPEIAAAEAELLEIFKDLHAHPEIGFEETRTAAIVAEKLKSFGIEEIHTGIGGTGVVALIRGRGTGNQKQRGCVRVQRDTWSMADVVR